MIKAPYNPVKGGKPATIAKDSDSGIMVIATVKPANISVRYNFKVSKGVYFDAKIKLWLAIIRIKDKFYYFYLDLLKIIIIFVLINNNLY